MKTGLEAFRHRSVGLDVDWNLQAFIQTLIFNSYVSCAFISVHLFVSTQLDNLWWLLLRWNLVLQIMGHWTLIQSTLWKFSTVEVQYITFNSARHLYEFYFGALYKMWRCDVSSLCSVLSADRGKSSWPNTFYCVTHLTHKHAISDISACIHGVIWIHTLSHLQYCEYMPEPAKCRHWLEKNFPDVFARMTVGGECY